MDKFPSTPHLSNLGTSSLRGDKVFTDKERDDFLSRLIVVEEKIDGANLGISFEEDGSIILRNRGSALSLPYQGQWKKLPDWLDRHIDSLFDALGTSKVMFGEWCYAKHSIEYTLLPDWFIGFDVFDLTQDRFMASEYRNRVLNQTGISVVAELGRGRFTQESLLRMMSLSAYGESPCEGLYLRIEEGLWLIDRAKIVRPEFMQSIDSHWSRKPLHPNKVISNWL